MDQGEGLVEQFDASLGTSLHLGRGYLALSDAFQKGRDSVNVGPMIFSFKFVIFLLGN